MNEGKTKGIICYIISALIIILLITYIIMGYVIYEHDSEGEPRDGLGRYLDEVPVAMGWIMPQWAGIIWFIIDCILALLVVVGLDRLLIQAKKYMKGIKNVDY